MTFNKYIFAFSYLTLKQNFIIILKRLMSFNYYYILKRSLKSLPEEKKLSANRIFKK